MVILAACVIAAATSCSSDTGTNSKPATSTPPASPTSDPKEEAARASALAAYKGMRSEQVKAFAAGTAVDTKLRTYAYDQALGKINSELFQMKQAGVVYKGQPTSELKVTAVNVTGTPPAVTIQECFDVTKWRATLNGRDVTQKGQPTRYVVNGTVREISKQWMVTDLANDKARAC
ncbi:hypothetical protein [Streptomyces sp. NPDC127084]|uniref:hypothetical protein n=1 Tax=Streptomyces sp. NPDC127084 TaxID=3347133 RepID=UPI00364EE211